MKFKFTLIGVFLVLFFNNIVAQHEYYGALPYGINSQGPNYFGGRIFKLDSLGGNFQVLYEFDSAGTLGANPYAPLIQATNGKLYGTTMYGGYSPQTGLSPQGVLFEFDPVIDSFHVVKNMPYTCRSALYQASNGSLYWTSSGSDGYLYEYNFVTDSIYQWNFIPYNETPIGISGEYNGCIYGLTALGGGNGNVGYGGRIFKFNLTTHTLTYLHNFFCATEGCVPVGNLIIASDGNMYGGLSYQVGNSSSSGGSIFRFNPQTNAVTHLVNIPDSIGNIISLKWGTNNKIYGTASHGTDAVGNHYGSIFEYDITLNQLRLVHNFGQQADQSFTGSIPTGDLLLASNGRMYGWCASLGPFEYDYLNNDLPTLTAIGVSSGSTLQGMIEICRKPAYTYFESDTIEVCNYTNFNYLISSPNTYQYQWLRNGVLMPEQTDSNLHFESFQYFDEAYYTCILTNSCGITTPIHGVQLKMIDLPYVSTIDEGFNYPYCIGEVAELSGNFDGVWSTGDSTYSITTVNNGDYFIQSSNVCGTVYSDTFTVFFHSIPPVPTINFLDGALVTNPGYGYNWTINSISIESAITNIYFPIYNGEYQVTIYDDFGCSSQSEVFNLISVSTSKVPKVYNELNIFPNPMQSETHLYFGYKQINTHIVVIDALGKEVFTDIIHGQHYQLSKGSLSSGIYSLLIQAEKEELIIRKLIIH